MISIIIPVLNEARTIRETLAHTMLNVAYPLSCECIIVDGGSNDNTFELVNEFKAAHPELVINPVRSTCGRARQMNAGADIARGEILYFLHADSQPPWGFDSLIRKEVEKGNPAGCFRMKFDSNHWWLRLAGWLTKFSWRACRGGDQSQFITRELFDEIGGFDESYVIYEDNIMINELFERKKFVVIQEWLTTSARLYEEKGIWYLQYHFWTIYVKKWMGASADELYDYYNRNIRHKKSKKQIKAQRSKAIASK
ncbi:MAG: glycosyl transferase family 2 [Cytophagaceae bacterium]|nr:glycosyl transferase family 2 [Cytophagaceae bacterium]|tara:strand:+ start:5374 stop:6135 length:762 start_codon:yes stop_codon:yes gene_type:complete